MSSSADPLGGRRPRGAQMVKTNLHGTDVSGGWFLGARVLQSSMRGMKGSVESHWDGADVSDSTNVPTLPGASSVSNPAPVPPQRVGRKLERLPEPARAIVLRSRGVEVDGPGL